MNATELRKGEKAVIVNVLLSDEKSGRLYDFGICIGAEIMFCTTTLYHDQLLFEVDGTLLADRRRGACQIEVKSR